MRIERLPDPVSISSEFGTVQIEHTFSGDTLTAVYAVSFTASRIAPEKYGDFREFINRAARLGRQRLRVVKD